MRLPRDLLLLCTFLLILISPLESASIGYRISGDRDFVLDTSLFPSGSVIPVLADDVQSREEWETERQIALYRHTHEGLDPPADQIPGSSQDLTWKNLNGRYSGESNELLRHIMIHEELDAILEVDLKAVDPFVIARVSLIHRSSMARESIDEQLLTLENQTEFDHWLLPVLYSYLYQKESAMIAIHSFSHQVNVTLDGLRYPQGGYYAISPGTHTLLLEAPLRIPREMKISLKPLETLEIEGELELKTSPGLLITGKGEASVLMEETHQLPYLTSLQELPFTVHLSRQGYLSEVITVTGGEEVLEVNLKRVGFNPEVIILKHQETFYRSLARTLLLFAASSAFETLSQGNQPVLSQLLNGLTWVSAGETAATLFDYYHKSKYSVNTTFNLQ